MEPAPPPSLALEQEDSWPAEEGSAKEQTLRAAL